MIWDAEFIGNLKVQDIIDMIKELLGKIFGFIAKEEGWNAEEEKVEA